MLTGDSHLCWVYTHAFYNQLPYYEQLFETCVFFSLLSESLTGIKNEIN